VANGNVAGYAGDVTPQEAWEILKNEKNAVLLDVRSAAEWKFIGIPDLASIDKDVTAIEWKNYPGAGDSMIENTDFIDQVKSICPNPDTKILSLCRSGQRSISTSIVLTNEGFNQCYNVKEGFEGDMNDDKHRGQTGGWKVRGLAWKQT
jgi:rhodanese-related sulfurtransferase